ncbi:small ubiquitin-related modifier 2-like [Primulina huaijiensis]|uniref:small ubiquitin-related modifier 2-like n=1 Tax=Primulina huaijiensis TaxID=1492673 RepID=UPI003CC74506
MDANENGKLPLETPHDRRVKLCFKAQDGTEVYYKFNADSKLQKLLITYCKENSLEHKDVRFLYNGKRLVANQTPAELDMHDEDEIDVMTHQHGGGKREEPIKQN